MDPVPPGIRQSLLIHARVSDSIREDWRVVREQYSMLEEKGIVRLFDPSSLIVTYDQLLTSAIAADIEDDALWNIFLARYSPAYRAVRGKLPSWSILKERIPPSTRELFRESVAPGYLGYVENQARYARGQAAGNEGVRALVWGHNLPEHVLKGRGAKFTGRFVEASPQQIFDAFFRWIQSDAEYGHQYDRWQMSLELEDVSTWVFAVTTSYVNGSAICVNGALLISTQLGTTLVTDSDVHRQMLLHKYHRAAKALRGNPERYPALQTHAQQNDLSRADYFSLQVFNRLVPEADLARMSLGDCLHYREASRDQLERLRSYLEELQTEVENRVWEPALEREVRDLIAKKIGPEARRIRDNMLSVRAKLVGGLTASLLTGGAPALIATVYPGLHPVLLLLFGASAVAGVSAAIATNEVIEALVSRQEIERNGLTYLLKLGR